MDRTLQLLHTPLGLPGSGRVRYGAAMELFQRGLVSEAQLDAYRDASPHDARDPEALLAERGLRPAPQLPATAAAAIGGLFTVAQDYLNGLSHPGHSEVSEGLRRCAGEVRDVTPSPDPVVTRWLAPALHEAERFHPQLAAAIAEAAPHLAWIRYDTYPRTAIGEGFADGHAFAAIAGGDAPIAATDFELGLFLIAPDVLYRDHRHPAPELYAPLTGPHGWRFAPSRPLIVKQAGEPVWNPSLRTHLTKVGPHPFLCLFAWTADVTAPAEVVAAQDWAALEASALRC